MSASKWQYSESLPKRIISETTIVNPIVAKGSLGKHSVSPQRQATRTTGSHESIPKQSPLHRHHHPKLTNKVGGLSPLRERKGSSEGGQGVVPNTPARSPLKPEAGIAVPKFGDWDEDNPSSGEAFTGIFNRVSEEKQTSATKVPMIIDDSIYLNSYHHDTSSSKPSTKWCCCFKWEKK